MWSCSWREERGESHELARFDVRHVLSRHLSHLGNLSCSMVRSGTISSDLREVARLHIAASFPVPLRLDQAVAVHGKFVQSHT